MMNFLRIVIIMLILFSNGLFHLQAQHLNLGRPFTKNYSKKDYKAGTQNWDIAQDWRGVMYFANNEGLLQFNGTTWKKFPLPNKTIVRSVSIAPDGRIYVGGQDEFGYFYPDITGNLQYNSLKELIPQEHADFEDVWDIVINNQVVFFSTSEKVYQFKNENINVFTDFSEIGFLGIVNNRIFLHDFQSGVMEFKSGKFEALDNENPVFSSPLSAAIPYNENTILFVTLKDGIYSFKNDLIEKWETKYDALLKESWVYSAVNLKNDLFALGTTRSGLIIMNKEGLITQHLDKRHGLQNNDVLSLFIDRSHDLWLGLDNGIDYVNINSPFTIIYPDRDLQGTAYTAKIHKEKIYFGTSNGLYYTDWKSHYTPAEKDAFKLMEGTQGQVWGLDIIDDDLFLNHHEGGFQIKNEKIYSLSDFAGSWQFLPLKDHPSYLINGTYSGMLLYEKQDGKWQFQKKVKGLDESSRIIAQDDQGEVWVSHPYRGVYKLSLNNLDDINVKFYDSNTGLPSDLFNYVYKVNNELIFAAEKGIYYYDEAQDRFKAYEEFNKIFGENEQINHLKSDANGNIWFVKNGQVGIVKINVKGVRKVIDTELFPELDNQIVGGFEYIYPYDEYNVFFGTNQGFIHLDPSKLEEIDKSLQVVFDEINLITEKDSLVFGGYFTDEKQIIAAQRSENIPTFERYQNAFRFNISASFYPNMEGVNYAYRLAGLDKDWSDWTSKTDKEYTNLPKGNYTFQVKAKNIYDVESKVISFQFEIKPVWYNTNFAYLIYLIFVSGIVLSLILIPRRAFKKEKEQLTHEHLKKEKQRLQEIQQSEEEIIKLKNEKLENEVFFKNKELASTTMHLVQKNELLSSIQVQLDKIAKESNRETKVAIKSVINLLNEDQQLDKDWEQFAYHFDQVHSNFLKRFREKYTHLTPKDHKLSAYLRMNLSSKEIAPLMNISVRGVEISRYRLRKKLDLDANVNLTEFMLQF